MQRIDQFRNFFPGHVSADRSAQNEESNRKRSQVSSNSQSQDFIKSQSTHFHSSFSGSTGDSQTSFTNRYDDMLASSRHAENKDLLEKCRKDLAASHSLISMQQSVLSSCINQLNSLGRAINEISVKQEDQGKLIMELLTKISEHTAREEEGRAHITSLFLSKQNCVEQEEECSSQDGMSLNAYLNSRSKRVRRESAGGAEGRASSQSSMELSLSPSAELTGQKRSRSATLTSEDAFRSPSRAPHSAHLAVHVQYQNPASQPQQRAAQSASAGVAVGGRPEELVDGSAGLLFDDF